MSSCALMKDALHFRCPGESWSVELTPAVLGHLQAHKQRRRLSCEAGGQLFARLDVPGMVQIVEATGPRPTDRRSLFGFEPDRHAERREIQARYTQGLHFVGDWHTHPQRIPVPSGRDERSMQEMVRQSAHDLPGFFMVIVGRADFPAGLYVAFHHSTGASSLITVASKVSAS